VRWNWHDRLLWKAKGKRIAMRATSTGEKESPPVL
jgi:hypothetical protein